MKIPKIKVFIEKENQTKVVQASTPEKLLDILKINSETVLIVKNNELITLNEKLKNNDKIKIISIISKG
ncbi:MoaD/ThiS family protein [archaeon]|nr:MoaD/ThiS family protein [archaeon]